MYHIVLIGAGQLGSRHLQGFAQIDIPISIEVVDPSVQALAIAKERFEQIPQNGFVKQITFHNALSSLNHPIDVGIVSTNADIRKQVVEELIHHIDIQYLILEKVAFQSCQEFEEIVNLLKQYRISAWVNCPRRMYSIYQEIQSNFTEGERVMFHLQGGNWRMGGNSIHWLDLFAFLIAGNNIILDASGLDKEIIQSRKNEFVEFSGTLKGRTKNGSELCLIADKRSEAPAVLDICGETFRCIVIESLKKAFYAHQANNWCWEEKLFEIPFQSQLSHLVIQKILKDGECHLTPINESFRLHQPLLEIFMTHLENLGQPHLRCPIT